MALWMDVGPEDLLCIGGDTYISVERKSGARARLKIVGKAEVELLKKRRMIEAPAANAPRADTGD
jgi:hypothetical protein